jgi:hypothetical protein
MFAGVNDRFEHNIFSDITDEFQLYSTEQNMWNLDDNTCDKTECACWPVRVC